MPIGPFNPTYIFPVELQAFGLPTPAAQPDIMNLMQTRNRNLALLPIKPIVALTPDVVAALTAQASGAVSGNYYLTGALQPNTFTGPWGTLSGIVGASGRYGYTRQDMSVAYPDLRASVAAVFGTYSGIQLRV